MRYLRANTATKITVGPFVDGVDGVTPETGLTVTNLKLTLMVDTGGVPTLVLNANATAAAGDNDLVHVANDTAGYYDLELTAAQCNYAGCHAKLSINHATANTCLPVFDDFCILPAQVYDSLINANDQLQVHANEITANLITAGAIADGAIDAATFAANAIGAAAIADGAIDAATFATNAITATVIADNAIDAGAIATGAITNAKFAANALDAAALAPDAGTEIAVAVWANATRALTDKTGFTAAPTAGSIAAASFAAGAIDAAAIADGAIDAATFAANAITSTVVADGTLTAAKFAANAISAAKLDPDVATEIWAKTGAATSLALDVLIERIYQTLHNRMLANESDGGITLRNFANSGDAATGSVVSSSNTTTRAVLAWA